MPLLLADDFPPQHGGIQRYMRGLADALHEMGRKVVVLAPDMEGASAYDASLPYRVVRYRARSRAERVIGIARACAAEASSRDYTLAALWFPGGTAASVFPRFVRGKLGVIVHGSDVVKPSGLKRTAMRLVLDRADAVMANSHFTQSLISAAGVARSVTVCGCGIDDFAVAAERSSSPSIVSVGRLIRRKGFDRLIAALPAVLRVLPDARCEIVGDGPERSNLDDLARTLNVAHAVRFLGSVDDAALHDAYARAWCFAMPARREESDVEGFGIVYLEAAIAGLAAIGGRDSGAADAIAHQESGLLVDAKSVNEIAGALITLLTDRERSEALGKRARERALQNFSWPATARRIETAMGVKQLESA